MLMLIKRIYLRVTTAKRLLCRRLQFHSSILQCVDQAARGPFLLHSPHWLFDWLWSVACIRIFMPIYTAMIIHVSRTVSSRFVALRNIRSIWRSASQQVLLPFVNSAGTSNFSLGDCIPGAGERRPPEADAVCRHCLQILTAETIVIWKFTHRNDPLNLDQGVSRWGGGLSDILCSPRLAPPLQPADTAAVGCGILSDDIAGSSQISIQRS